MKKISTFIFIHDQDVLIKYLETNKFSNFTNLKYVFVGNKSIDKIDSLSNVIVARNLPINIEQYPLFTSFTGWYALWKNNLISSDYINLFEYDIIISNEFNKLQEEKLNQDIDFMGYVPLPMSNFNYVKNVNWVKDIIPSIKKNYGIDMYKKIEDFMNKNPNEIWSSTSNSTFSKKTFDEYMKWFEILFNDLKNSNTAGHAHERSISFFYLIKNKKISILTNALKHYQLNSHGTSGHIVDFENSIKFITKN